MQVDIKQLPALRVATVRHVGSYETISEAFEKLSAAAGAAGLFERPETQLVAIYHNDPASTPTEKLLSDAGLIVAEGVPLPDGVEEQRLAAGTYACTLHLGSYKTLGDTWSRLLHEWLPSSGRRAGSGPNYELYLNNPHEAPEDKLRTELRIPLADR